ncbi:MAG TPA: septum formation initiator family protein [Acidobacteriaceae bacterium]
MNRAVHPTPSPTQPGRLARRFSVATAAYAQRRRIATVFAVVIAVMVGYHALFGANGVVAYRAKRAEDHVLAQQLEKMKLENSQLKGHVEHLKSDPDAIEYEAHMRLRYTRPDQVIVLNNTPNTAARTPNTAAPAANTAAPAANSTPRSANPATKQH